MILKIKVSEVENVFRIFCERVYELENKLIFFQVVDLKKCVMILSDSESDFDEKELMSKDQRKES